MGTFVDHSMAGVVSEVEKVPKQKCSNQGSGGQYSL